MYLGELCKNELISWVLLENSIFSQLVWNERGVNEQLSFPWKWKYEIEISNEITFLFSFNCKKNWLYQSEAFEILHTGRSARIWSYCRFKRTSACQVVAIWNTPPRLGRNFRTLFYISYHFHCHPKHRTNHHSQPRTFHEKPLPERTQ